MNRKACESEYSYRIVIQYKGGTRKVHGPYATLSAAKGRRTVLIKEFEEYKTSPFGLPNAPTLIADFTIECNKNDWVLCE